MIFVYFHNWLFLLCFYWLILYICHICFVFSALWNTTEYGFLAFVFSSVLKSTQYIFNSSSGYHDLSKTFLRHNSLIIQVLYKYDIFRLLYMWAEDLIGFYYFLYSTYQSYFTNLSRFNLKLLLIIFYSCIYIYYSGLNVKIWIIFIQGFPFYHFPFLAKK